MLLLSEGGVFYLRPGFFESFSRGDEAVRPLLDREHAESIPYTNLRFAVQACSGDSYYIGGRAEEQALWLLSGGSVRPLDFLAGGEASDNAEPACGQGLVFLGDFIRGRLYGIDAETADVVFDRTVEDAGAREHPAKLTFIRVDEQRNRLYATSDYSGVLRAYDLPEGAEVARLSIDGSVFHFTIDPRDGRLLMISASGKLYEADPDELVPRKVGELPGLLICQLVLDEHSGLLLASSFMTGMINAYDSRTFEPRGSRYFGSGVRFMADVPGPGVAVSNYFSGRLEIIDPEAMEILAGTRTGRRTRWLALTRDGRGLTTVSSRGPLFVDLDALGPKE